MRNGRKESFRFDRFCVEKISTRHLFRLSFPSGVIAAKQNVVKNNELEAASPQLTVSDPLVSLPLRTPSSSSMVVVAGGRRRTVTALDHRV